MGFKWVNGFYIPNPIMPTPNPTKPAHLPSLGFRDILVILRFLGVFWSFFGLSKCIFVIFRFRGYFSYFLDWPYPSTFKNAGTCHSHSLMRKSCPSAFKSTGIGHSDKAIREWEWAVPALSKALGQLFLISEWEWLVPALLKAPG